jgi:peroxiredoxin
MFARVLSAVAVGRRTRLGVMAALLGLALAGCGDNKQAPPSTFVLLDGSTMTTQDLKGKVTLVNFWATTCVSCVKEMPMLADTYNQFKDRGFETIAVAMSYDPPDWVQNFAQTRQLPFSVALDNTGEIARDWGDVRLTPTTYIVDKRGRIIKRYVGEPDFRALHQLLDKLLAES